MQKASFKKNIFSGFQLFIIFCGLIALHLIVLRPATGFAFQANTLCQNEEKIIFSCSIQNKSKLVSFCASKNFSTDPKNGYLKYRFGKLDKIELEYPKNKEGSFTYSEYNRWGGKMNAGLNLFSINFETDGFDYHLYSDYSALSNKSSQGVRVGEKEIPCRRPVINNFEKYRNAWEQVITKE